MHVYHCEILTPFANHTSHAVNKAGVQCLCGNIISRNDSWNVINLLTDKVLPEAALCYAAKVACCSQEYPLKDVFNVF